MNCFICERPSCGICIFCGRALCKSHTKTLPHVISIFRNKDNKLNAIVTDEALYCGECKPREEPIDISEIEKNN